MKQTDELTWDKFLKSGYKYNDYEYPRVSIVIPTYNNSEKIPLTLDSIFNQRYPDLEIIIIDGNSTDRTLEVVKNYRDERIHIFSVSGYNRYEMLNKGISQTKGEYVNFLFPGDFYIHQDTLMHMMKAALDHHKPDLVYCGTLIRDGRTDPKILFRPFTINLLKKGQQPTSLQSCWFRLDSLRSLGKFNTGYVLRGGFELMCRIILDQSMNFVSTGRVLTDYDLRSVSREMVFDHFTETWRTIRNYFGFLTAFKWLFFQKDISRILNIWWRSVKVAFLGRATPGRQL